ncbi:MAG: TonB-dependent receptor [Methylovulum sp.]|nr:TonB-dependent receptor [Methylovulum sp.]
MQKLIISSLLLTGITSPTQAQATGSQNMSDLPSVVVTATRTETPKNQLAAAATVYTRQDIERLQVKTFPDLLRGGTGADMTQQGGYGKTTSVFMRGANSDHILVMIDGIKVGSATLGATPFEFIPIDQIERVEIIRGPQSSLYGSEAIGGVIQIFTRKGHAQQKPSITLDAGGGSYDTAQASGTVSGTLDNSWYNLGVSHFNSQGFNAQQATPGPYGVDQPDRDGYENTALNARVGHHFDNNAEIDAFFMRAEGATEYDGSYQDKTDFLTQVVGTSASIDVLDDWRSSLRLGQSLDQNDQFTPDGLFSSRFNTSRWNATWLNQVTLSESHQLTIGSDYRVDEIDSSEKYLETSRYDVGVFTELHSRVLDNHFVNASVRWDENQAFGDYMTGNIGWRYNGDYGLSPFASFGNAFKSPNFNDLYYPNYGNPSLSPEESASVEVGLAGDHWLQWEIRAYHTDIDNLITPVMDAHYNFSAQNIGKAQIDGLELEISKQWLGWHGKLGMNLLNPENRETNAQLPRRSDKSLSFDMSKAIGAFDLGVNVLAQGGRFNEPQDQNRVAGFVTVDLRSAYRINKNWILSAKLNNLLDKTYQTVNTYNTADRNFFLSLHYNN